MRIIADDNLDYYDHDLIQVTPLEDLSDDLIDECLEEQIKIPGSSKSNYLEEFRESHEDQIDEASDADDNEAVGKLNGVAASFYRRTIDMIDKRFGLDIDEDMIDDMDLTTLRNISEGLYEFFVVNYINNASHYLATKIIKNRHAIYSILKEENRDDIVTKTLKIRVKDPEFAYILANINRAIELMRSDENASPELFVWLFNEEEFGVAIVKYCVMNGIINGDFVEKFLDITFGRIQDDLYDIIALQIQQTIYQAYKATMTGIE